jgi:hypothetical protein
MNRLEIEKVINENKDLIISVIYPFGIENGMGNIRCTEAEAIFQNGVDLLQNAQLFSSTNINKIQHEFSEELTFLMMGSCAIGIMTAKNIIDRDKFGYDKIIQNSINIVMEPTIKIANKLIDLCNRGNVNPFSSYDPKKEFYKNFLDGSFKLIEKTNLVVTEKIRNNPK